MTSISITILTKCIVSTSSRSNKISYIHARNQSFDDSFLKVFYEIFMFSALISVRTYLKLKRKRIYFWEILTVLAIVGRQASIFGKPLSEPNHLQSAQGKKNRNDSTNFSTFCIYKQFHYATQNTMVKNQKLRQWQINWLFMVGRTYWVQYVEEKHHRHSTGKMMHTTFCIIELLIQWERSHSKANQNEINRHRPFTIDLLLHAS